MKQDFTGIKTYTLIDDYPIPKNLVTLIVQTTRIPSSGRRWIARRFPFKKSTCLVMDFANRQGVQNTDMMNKDFTNIDFSEQTSRATLDVAVPIGLPASPDYPQRSRNVHYRHWDW